MHCFHTSFTDSRTLCWCWKLMSQVHYFSCLFLLYTCIPPAACLVLLKIYLFSDHFHVFLSLPGMEKSIWVSLREYSLKNITGDSGFVTQLDFLLLNTWNFFHRGGDRMWSHCLNPGLWLTCQLFIPLSLSLAEPFATLINWFQTPS